MPGDEIVCKFRPPKSDADKPGGKSPKFVCGPCQLDAREIAAGKKPCTVQRDIKVKYSGKGRPLGERNPQTLATWAREDAQVNGEVFAEVVGTRLLWALGFFADGVYPTKVICYDCPEDPWQVYRVFPRATNDPPADRRWEFGAVEIKIPGTKIEYADQSGFDWEDDSLRIVGRADPAAEGPATPEEVDAWRLLASFMVHTDNKAANQRLFCAQGKRNADGTCAEPRAMIQDIGLSFGTNGMIPRVGFLKGVLGQWEVWDLWKTPQDRARDGNAALGSGQCQARLTPIVSSSRHSLVDPVVSEGGRKLLAELMSPTVLTDEMLTKIFAVSRIAERAETKNGRLVTVADWVRAFDERRAEILRGCPEQHVR